VTKPLKLNPLEVARQALLPAGADADADGQDRVEQLFRSRAELKKAYSEVQDELFRLKDRLKQQEAATARVQEKLQNLEGRLEWPDTGWSTLVFFHLRRFWRTGSGVLQQYALDLERQHVERERRSWLAAVNRDQFARRQQAEAAVLQAEAGHADSSRQLAQLQRDRAALTRPWHHFKRKSLDARLAAAAVRQRADADVLAEARAALDELLRQGESPFPGLSVEARRAINLAVIAFAELLCARVGNSPVVAQARAATRRSEPAEDYGTRRDCETLMTEIARLQALIEQGTSLGDAVRARAEELAAVVAYAGADATIPDPVSLRRGDAEKPRREPRGPAPPRPAPVLEQESWEIFSALRR
jgi:septal ring factor EnvC (AmiA/AmiB activator)